MSAPGPDDPWVKVKRYSDGDPYIPAYFYCIAEVDAAHAADAAHRERLQQENALLRDALRGVRIVPRPWIDGGVSWREWDDAMTKLEAVLKEHDEAKAL